MASLAEPTSSTGIPRSTTSASNVSRDALRVHVRPVRARRELLPRRFDDERADLVAGQALHVLHEALALRTDARHEVGLALALDRYVLREAGERVFTGLEQHALRRDGIGETQLGSFSLVDEDAGPRVTSD
jgi:hypothetical protein